MTQVDYLKNYTKKLTKISGKKAGEKDVTCPACGLYFLDLDRHARKAHRRTLSALRKRGASTSAA